MKKTLLIIAALCLLMACGKEDEQPESKNALGKSSGQVFYARTESHKQPETKVYADEDMQVLWNEDDRITVFNKSTYNYEYKFMGEDGDNFGSFEEIPVSGLISGNSLNSIYALYPYSKNNKINNSGTVVTMVLPSEQSYKAHSFGIGANAMAAVTDNNFLAFKNICGYLCFRLYGDKISVSSISIRGNNGEKIAGKASIAVSYSTDPVTTMDNTATDTITLACDPPVRIGSSADKYTDFCIAIPPTTFDNGFTITVTDNLGFTFEKTTSNSLTISRNQIEWMNPLKVEPHYPSVSWKEAGAVYNLTINEEPIVVTLKRGSADKALSVPITLIDSSGVLSLHPQVVYFAAGVSEKNITLTYDYSRLDPVTEFKLVFNDSLGGPNCYNEFIGKCVMELQYEDYKKISYYQFWSVNTEIMAFECRDGSFLPELDSTDAKIQRVVGTPSLYKLILFDNAAKIEFKSIGDGNYKVMKYAGYNDYLIKVDSNEYFYWSFYVGNDECYIESRANMGSIQDSSSLDINREEILVGDIITIEGWIRVNGTWIGGGYNTYQDLEVVDIP